MAGFRYCYHSSEGDELGEFTAIVSNWTACDTFTTGDGRQFRICGWCRSTTKKKARIYYAM